MKMIKMIKTLNKVSGCSFDEINRQHGTKDVFKSPTDYLTFDAREEKRTPSIHFNRLLVHNAVNFSSTWVSIQMLH